MRVTEYIDVEPALLHEESGHPVWLLNDLRERYDECHEAMSTDLLWAA